MYYITNSQALQLHILLMTVFCGYFTSFSLIVIIIAVKYRKSWSNSIQLTFSKTIKWFLCLYNTKQLPFAITSFPFFYCQFSLFIKIFIYFMRLKLNSKPHELWSSHKFARLNFVLVKSLLKLNIFNVRKNIYFESNFCFND